MSDRLPTILLVEDELLVRMSAVDHLQEVGFQVIEAATADDALGVLDVRSEEVDVLFSDIDMPGTLDGIALAERVASVWPRILIVLCSGKTREAASSCAPDGFIAKPYVAAAVAQYLRELLPRSPEPPNLSEPRGGGVVTTETRELYASPNGDRWYLACETKSHQVYVLHIGNPPSGGHRSRMELGEFLGRADHAPEQQALSRLIGTLARNRFDFQDMPSC